MQSSISCLFPITAYGEWEKGWGVPGAWETPFIENGIEKWENDNSLSWYHVKTEGIFKMTTLSSQLPKYCC